MFYFTGVTNIQLYIIVYLTPYFSKKMVIILITYYNHILYTLDFTGNV